jgi:hypothetical protein
MAPTYKLHELLVPRWRAAEILAVSPPPVPLIVVQSIPKPRAKPAVKTYFRPRAAANPAALVATAAL